MQKMEFYNKSGFVYNLKLVDLDQKRLTNILLQYLKIVSGGCLIRTGVIFVDY